MSYHYLSGLGSEPAPPSVWPIAVGFPPGYQDFWSSAAGATFVSALGTRGWKRKRLVEGQLRLASTDGEMGWDDGGPEVPLTLSTVAYEWSGQGYFVMALCEGPEADWRLIRVPPQLIASYRGPTLYVVAMPNHEAPTAEVWAKYVTTPITPGGGTITPGEQPTPKNPHPWVKGGFPGVVVPDQPGPGPEAPPFGRTGLTEGQKTALGVGAVVALAALAYVGVRAYQKETAWRTARSSRPFRGQVAAPFDHRLPERTARHPDALDAEWEEDRGRGQLGSGARVRSLPMGWEEA